ncbi:MAG: hypothetical protein CL399_07955, partial [Acidiferrobacteraceae bacterium]|nr:hypothetical protein [Acidiferrobacteraceae bacterium]
PEVLHDSPELFLHDPETLSYTVSAVKLTLVARSKHPSFKLPVPASQSSVPDGDTEKRSGDEYNTVQPLPAQSVPRTSPV